MNNEPVAWMNAHTGHLCSGGFLMTKMQDYIPLYTHPANEKVKETTDLYEKVCNCRKKLNLTDEEIDAVWFSYKGDIKDFAKAILRKAQEK
jgi:hypothetical protein